jgi:hypothetical protein
MTRNLTSVTAVLMLLMLALAPSTAAAATQRIVRDESWLPALFMDGRRGSGWSHIRRSSGNPQLKLAPCRGSRSCHRPAPSVELGFYVTRPSRTRKITIHVSGDGKHVVGLKIKMQVPCQHGSFLLEISFLSYAEAVTITNGVARETLEVGADHELKAGDVGMFLQFGANGTLEGRLRVHIPFRSRRVGLCEGTLKFTATKT